MLRTVLLLVPADVFRPRFPDDAFTRDVAAARRLGWDVAVVDHDELTRGTPARAVRRVPEGVGPAVYRGWMMHPRDYRRFEGALADRGTVLRTTAAAYAAAHELPGWCSLLPDLTPETVWIRGTDPLELAAAMAPFAGAPAVLRDFVKSEKHYWDEAAYIPSAADPAAVERVVGRFLELRGDELTGGLVARRFEPLDGAEARTWWVDGALALVTAHPDTPHERPDPGTFVDRLSAPVRALGSPFCTADLARRVDGRWRVIELGDGQVSGCPTGAELDPVLAALSRAAGTRP